MRKTTATGGPAPRRSPGEQARLEAAEYQGRGRSKLALARRRSRILRLLMRGLPAGAITEMTGFPRTLVEKDAAEIEREQMEKVSAFDARRDAADQLARFDEARTMILEDIAALEASHPNRPRLWAELVKLEQTRHVFLERAGLRKPLDQGGPPDAADLRGRPTYLIEQEMAHIAQALYERVDPAGYLRAVERMRAGDVIDVPALATGTGEEDDGGGGDAAA